MILCSNRVRTQTGRSPGPWWGCRPGQNPYRAHVTKVPDHADMIRSLRWTGLQARGARKPSLDLQGRPWRLASPLCRRPVPNHLLHSLFFLISGLFSGPVCRLCGSCLHQARLHRGLQLKKSCRQDVSARLISSACLQHAVQGMLQGALQGTCVGESGSRGHCPVVLMISQRSRQRISQRAAV